MITQYEIDQQLIVLMRMYLHLKVDDGRSSTKREHLIEHIFQKIMELTGSNLV